jgi:hypothetical protein
MPCPENGIRSVTFASGAALLLRMDALASSGDFDERLFLYHEDGERQIRLRQPGYDCVLERSSTRTPSDSPHANMRCSIAPAGWCRSRIVSGNVH